MALDAANNRALVVDTGLVALLAVDLVTGDRIVTTDTNTGTGPAFIEPKAVVLDTVNNRALVVDDGLDALLAVDLASGNRVIVSQ